MGKPHFPTIDQDGTVLGDYDNDQLKELFPNRRRNWKNGYFYLEDDINIDAILNCQENKVAGEDRGSSHQLMHRTFKSNTKYSKRHRSIQPNLPRGFGDEKDTLKEAIEYLNQQKQMIENETQRKAQEDQELRKKEPLKWAFMHNDPKTFLENLNIEKDITAKVSRSVQRNHIALGKNPVEWATNLMHAAQSYVASEERKQKMKKNQLVSIPADFHQFKINRSDFEYALAHGEKGKLYPLPFSHCVVVCEENPIAWFIEKEGHNECRSSLKGAEALMNTIIRECDPIPCEDDPKTDLWKSKQHSSPTPANFYDETTENTEGLISTSEGVDFTAAHLPNSTQQPRQISSSHSTTSRKMPKAHIRKAHNRRQHYGPKNQYIKLIRIQETEVTGRRSKLGKHNFPLIHMVNLGH